MVTIKFPRFPGRSGEEDQRTSEIRNLRTRLLDESQLRYLQRLTFASGKLVTSGLSGEHRSSRRGPSPEFADFKSYSPGDDFRRIDWNSYARLDQLFIKENEVTTERDIHVFVDAGNTMDWSSADEIPTKFGRARQIASMLGYIAIWHFDRLSIQRLGVEASTEFGPVQGRSNTLRMLNFCEGMTLTRTSTETESIRRHLQRKKRPGRLFIISDFNWTEPDELRETLSIAASRRWQSTLILIEDPGEIDPSPMFEETTKLELESATDRGRMHVSGSRQSLDTYRRSRLDWIEQLEGMTSLPGVTFLSHNSSEPDASALFGRLFELKVIRR